jgi:hypothetical protein
MSIFLTAGSTTIELDPDLQWVDRHSWSPVVQNVTHSVNGNLIIDEAVKLAGRPITLQPPDAAAAWMPLSVVSQLEALAAEPDRDMQLSIHGTTFPVRFRHTDGPAVEASPRLFVRDPAPGGFGDDYLTTLRFIEI